MDMFMSVNVHLTDDTRIHAKRSGDTCWISISDDVHIFFEDENQLSELIQAVDVMAKHMADKL